MQLTDIIMKNNIAFFIFSLTIFDVFFIIKLKKWEKELYE